MSIKTILIGAVAVLSISCAQKPLQDGSSHHHHKTACKGAECETKVQACDVKKCKMGKCEMYEKKCALSVSKGKYNTPGLTKYELKHGGHNYYFSSKKSLEQFKANIEENIKLANERWSKFKWTERR
ncbi:MAG: hypothetical protein KC478_05145 [Bacteriovoracaceae bacterium]|nr:hypothetical protein [Bacteriovoracaceae bacterium]